ncbi:MAG TPA: fimbria/pilus outer membrane usher protein [Steroidobacteraceae bacterium]
MITVPDIPRCIAFPPVPPPMPVTRQPAAEETWLSVNLNGSATEQVVLALREGPDIFIDVDDLKKLQLLVHPTTRLSYGGKTYCRLHDIPGMAYRTDERQQTLFIQADATLFHPKTVIAHSLASGVRPTLPPNGAFLNYDLLGSRVAGIAQTSALVEGDLFGPLGSGLIRFQEQDTTGTLHSVRLEMTWTRDLPDTVTSLRLGDSITGTSRWWGGAVRFGGVQWGTNFATRPDLITTPTPIVTGESVLPSTLDLYVNGALRLRQDVAAGPFTVQNIPVITGAGDVRLVVTDALGRQQIVTQSYYASPQMLEAGLTDYSYEAGFIRNNFGVSSTDYGRALLVGTHRIGLSDDLTGEIHGEFLHDQQSAGVAAARLLPAGVVASLGVAASHSLRGKGELVSVGLERTTPRFSVGANAQLASRDFVSLGLGSAQLAPVRTLRAFAGYSSRVFGSTTASFTREDFRDRPGVELISLSQGIRVGVQGYLSLSALHVIRSQPDTTISLLFTRALWNRTTGNLSLTVDKEHAQGLLEIQRSLPLGTGAGYRFGVGTEEREASISLQSNVGTYQLDTDSLRGETGVRGSVSGSIALLNGTLFASRHIDDSFAVAEVADRPGVHVYSDNQLVGTTNSKGHVFLSQLRAYQTNSVRIDVADLPLDFNVDAAGMVAVPYARSGLLLRFPIKRADAALISLMTESGKPLPPGTEVVLVDARAEPSRTFAVGLNGETYVTGLTATNHLRASWQDHTCELHVSYSRGEDPWQRLGPFTCKEIAPE